MPAAQVIDRARRALRILQVVSSPAFAGVERYITYVAPALAARGCEVTVAGGDPLAMQERLRGSGVHHVAAATVVEAALRVAQSRRVDIVHAHMTSAEWATVPLRPFTSAAYVSTRHFAAVRGRPGAVRALSRLLPMVLDQQISISSFVAAAIREPSVVIHNGVPTPEVGRSTPRPVVLVMQRFEAEKDTALALRAWAHGRARTRGWTLLLAGQGSLETKLKEQSSALGLNDSVEFLGHRSDISSVLSQAGMVLATASGEPFGLSVVEAMAAAVPVVAAGSGAHLETVGACSTDYLFPPGDAASCADRIDSLADDESRRDRYGTVLQAYQRRHFDLDTHVDRLLALYVEVSHRPRSRTDERRRSATG